MKGKLMFSTKQLILILITQPLQWQGKIWTNPTVRDIERGLRKHFQITRTRRHIRRLLRELENEGIIRRQIRSSALHPLGTQHQASTYTIVNFNGAFQDHPSLLGAVEVMPARDPRLRKRKEV